MAIGLNILRKGKSVNLAKEKFLLIMRHATAGHAFGAAADFDRSLTDHGKAEARNVGEQLMQAELAQPLHIICSEARRAKQSLQGVLDAGLQPVSVSYNSVFYQAGPEQVISAVSASLPADDAASLLLIGHNPSWSELVGHLSGDIISLSPAHCILLRRRGNDWKELLQSQEWELVERFRP